MLLGLWLWYLPVPMVLGLKFIHGSERQGFSQCLAFLPDLNKSIKKQTKLPDFINFWLKVVNEYWVLVHLSLLPGIDSISSMMA